MGSDGTLLPPGAQGEVVVRRPNIMAGYDHNPEANRAAFIDGWLRTGDEGRLDGDGPLRLTGRIEEVGAAVVLHSSAATTEQELRDFAAGRLADFKVPHTVVFLAEIPGAELAPPRVYTAPRTPVERMLAQLWGDVLKAERVGVDQPFFELGGDSMLATLLASRIREEIGVEVSVRTVFDAPTVAEQATVLVDLLLEETPSIQNATPSARPTGAQR